MPLNWLIEAKKWQLLLNHETAISLKRAFLATLGGTTVSLVTPNRVGGFLGRILFLKKEHRVRASFISVLGNFSQLFTTVFMGVFGVFLVLAVKVPIEENILEYLPVLLTLSALVFIVMAILLYRSKYLVRGFQLLPFFKRFTKQAETLKQFSVSQINQVNLLSAFRYLVFATQFVFLLKALQLPIGWISAYSLTALMYLLVTTVPSLVLGNLGIRESFVLLLFAGFTDSNAVLLLASLLIWLINLVVPAISGGIAILYIRYQPDKV